MVLKPDWHKVCLFSMERFHLTVIFHTNTVKVDLQGSHSLQSKRNDSWVQTFQRTILLSTCPSDKHHIKFGCLKPKSSCPKSLARFLTQTELIKFKNVLVLDKFVKGLHVRTKFLPLPDNHRTVVLVRPGLEKSLNFLQL